MASCEPPVRKLKTLGHKDVCIYIYFSIKVQNNPNKIQAASMMEVRYEWPIDDDDHRRLHLYEKLHSSPFHLSGDIVQLRLYLSGYYSIELIMAGPGQQQKVVAVNALSSSQTNEIQLPFLRGNWTVTYTYTQNSIASTTRFQPLTEKQIINFGCGPPTGFTLLCKFTVEDARITRNQAEVNSEKMDALLKRGELTDVVLVASDGRELATHRAILAAHSQV
jgi:hypothetical protein